MCTCNTNTNCNPTPCGCKFTVTTDCVINRFSPFCTIGVQEGKSLTEVLEALDVYVCALAQNLQTGIIFRNVGGQPEIYKGKNAADGVEEFRTISTTSSINSVQQTDTIELTVNETWLSTFIQNLITNTNLTSSLLLSIGDSGQDIYKGFNTTSNKHEIRKIKSDSLNISIDGDAIKIEQPNLDSGLRPFYVNNQYTGTEEIGTIAKPYKTLDAARTAYVGTGTILSPQFVSSTIIIQKSTQIYGHILDLSIGNIIVEVEEGARTLYTGTEDYIFDTRKFLTHPDYVDTDNKGITIHGEGLIESRKGLIYAKGTGFGDTDFNKGLISVTIKGNLRMAQIYGIDVPSNFINIPATVGGTDFYGLSNLGVPIKFFNGNTLELPAIVCDDDNRTSVNITLLGDLIVVSATQVVLQIKPKGYFNMPINSANKLVVGTLSSTFSHYGTISGASGTSTIVTAHPTYAPISMEEECVASFNNLSCNYGNIPANTIRCIKHFININNSATSLISSLVIRGGSLLAMSQFEDIIAINSATNQDYVSLDGLLINPVFGVQNTGYAFNAPNFTNYTNLLANNCTLSSVDFSPIVDLTRNNLTTVENNIKGNKRLSLRKYVSRASAITSGLQVGDLFINTNNNNANTATHFIDTIV